MQSNLRQHITSMVKDIIPLGGPARHRGNEKGNAHPAPQCSSQETNQTHAHTLLNPILRCPPSRNSSVLERRSSSKIAFPSHSQKVFEGGQKSLSNCSVSMKKVQINNSSNSNHHLNKEGSCQSAGKKDAHLQKQGSYDRQREFALALCKQLNDNLKVVRPVSQIGITQHKMPSVYPHAISSSMSESHKVSAPRNSQKKWSLDSRMNQQSQLSDEKMDKPIDLDQSSSLLGQEEHGSRQQTRTPVEGRSLSLKRLRLRESSAESNGDGKRLCLEEIRPTPSSTNGHSSNFSSQPKFVKRAFLKSFKEPVLTLDEKPSPTLNNCTQDRTRASNNVAKQFFQKPKTESNKLQTTTLSTVVHGTGNQKEEIGRSTESKCLIGNSDTVDSCLSLSSKPKQEEDGLPVSLNTSSLLGSVNGFEVSCSPSSLDITCSHNSKTIIKATKDVEEERDLVWKDPLDLELEDGVGLESCVLSLSSSHSGEEDHLLSLKEILERSTCVLATPDKMTFSEPSTPDLKIAPEDFKNKTTGYKNTLEKMLKEKEQNQKSKELEIELLQACKEDLLKLDEEDENAEEGLSHEQREFLEKFSVSSCVIRDIHPGEEVFTLTNFGRLFNHQSLDLRKIGVTPSNRAQQTLLQAHSEHLLPLLSAGLFRRAYLSSPCQPQVTRWLFQMMSVHPNPVVCAQILQAMTTIALSAAQHIVEKSNKKFEVWVPSIEEVALVFLNMGVSFVSLFPLEALQPPFTEGDLLESLEIQPDGKKHEKEGDSFPEHNFENIIKYLALCSALCPRAYDDDGLLLMLTVVCRVSLETRLQLLPAGDLSCLLQHTLNNMTDWEMQLPQVCQAITNLSEDHHNLRRLVQLLPHNSRGKQLRRHVSVSIISKLLNHRCTYIPLGTEFQLSDLRCYLPLMRPSLLLKALMAAKTTEPQETDDCATTPDQQAYYLCYSLLALTNEASNFEFLPSKQRNELLLLSAELEKHVKCDIRESEKMLYRSKVKDFVARIYTKWQVLLQRSRPQEGKLYDYWKPLPEVKIPTKKSPQSTEHESTEDSLSEASDMVQSDEEQSMEEEDEVPTESEENLEGSVEKTEENLEELHEVPAEIKEEQCLTNLDGKNAEKTKDDMGIDEELLGGSSEGSVETDEDLIKREEELLKDDESLDRNQHVEEENDECEDRIHSEEVLLRGNESVDTNEDLVGEENNESENSIQSEEELFRKDASVDGNGDLVGEEISESEDLFQREELPKGDESLDRYRDLVEEESDESEDIIVREEFKGDECLDKSVDLLRSVNDKPKQLELIEKHLDMLEKTIEELLLDI